MVERRVTEFESRMQSEQRDPEWSARAEAAFADVMAGDTFAGSELIAVECAKTLCRAEIGHAGIDGRDDFLNTAPLTPPFDEEGFATHIEDGAGVRSVVFVARKGHELLPETN
jgi:hypothetical protein